MMSRTDKVNILVVDDLPEKILTIETVLEDLGENLVKAGSGEEALRRVLDEEFAVILLDVNMPRMDGFETAELIRRRKRSAHTPIIFLTAFMDEIREARGYSLGAVDYILTPVVPEILRGKIKVFVELYRMSQQVKRQAEEHVILAREQAARAAAEALSDRMAFLAEASRTLADSLNPDTTARSITQIAVPFLADLACITIAPEGNQYGASEVSWLSFPDQKRHDCRIPTIGDEGNELRDAVERVLASGSTEFRDPLNSPFPIQAEHRLTSALVLPLRARGRTLGVLTLGRGPSGRCYESNEIAVAEDLASRSAIALDNAYLHQNIQEDDRRKSEFLSILAHELRNPLSPIRNAVAIMQLMEIRDTVLIEARDIIDRQVTHMARLIDDLLDISRLTRGKILLRKTVIDLTELVRTTTSDYRRTLESAGLRLEVRLPREPVWTFGDPTRLAQILGNVLHNAAKFTDPGGEVIVELMPVPDEQALLIVRDTGIGIEGSMLARVFDSFAQADVSLERGKGGLGLGLALVKGLINLHGGEVQVKSPGLGCGTVVEIRLPLRESSRSLTGESPISDKYTRRRVLIVEDNRDAAESLRALLTMMGHEVHIAHSAEMGLELARSSTPELILCDLGLPGKLDGLGFARVVRHTPTLSGTYLVAVTGFGQEEDRRRSQDAGFDTHLTKPVDVHHLKQLFLSKLVSV